MPSQPRPDAFERGGKIVRRTRTFRPNYVSFSGTYQCNLTCAHCCVPIEWPDRLDIDTAERFLVDAHAEGIATIGFTGGEPFLYPEFVLALTRKAAGLGMRFDKVQTNGVWFSDIDQLEKTLTALREAGFTGKLGLSVDKFHGKHTAAAALFCRAARRIFDRDNIVSLSYASRSPELGLEPAHALARELAGIIDWSDLLHRFMLVSDELTIVLNWNHLAPVERAERLTGAWDGAWFEEDYCEGPGQALIVTPRGEVKPCCGFASDLDQLTIGNIHTDTAAQIIRQGRDHPFVGKVFREGLTAIRDEILATDPEALPGMTSNHCFFCWHVLSKNLPGVPFSCAKSASADRISLGLLRPASAEKMTVLMRFDGKSVWLGERLPMPAPDERGERFRIHILGPAPVEVPNEPMAWDAYQRWIDGLRTRGFTLTTERMPSARGSLLDAHG